MFHAVLMIAMMAPAGCKGGGGGHGAGRARHCGKSHGSRMHHERHTRTGGCRQGSGGCSTCVSAPTSGCANGSCPLAIAPTAPTGPEAVPLPREVSEVIQGNWRYNESHKAYYYYRGQELIAGFRPSDQCYRYWAKDADDWGPHVVPESQALRPLPPGLLLAYRLASR